MPTARPSKPRSMSAHHVRWYTALRSPSTDVAINASTRVVERAGVCSFQARIGGCGRQNLANDGFAGLFADAALSESAVSFLSSSFFMRASEHVIPSLRSGQALSEARGTRA